MTDADDIDPLGGVADDIADAPPAATATGAPNLPYPEGAWRQMKVGPLQEPVPSWVVDAQVSDDDVRLPSAAVTWINSLRANGWSADASVLTWTLDGKDVVTVAVLGRRADEWLMAWWRAGKFDGARGARGAITRGAAETPSAMARPWIKAGVPEDAEWRAWDSWRARRGARLALAHRKAAVEVATTLGGTLLDVRYGAVDGAHDEAVEVVCPSVFRAPRELVDHALTCHGVDVATVAPDLARAMELHDEAHAMTGTTGVVKHRHERWPLGEPPKPRKPRAKKSDEPQGDLT